MADAGSAGERGQPDERVAILRAGLREYDPPLPKWRMLYRTAIAQRRIAPRDNLVRQTHRKLSLLGSLLSRLALTQHEPSVALLW